MTIAVGAHTGAFSTSPQTSWGLSPVTTQVSGSSFVVGAIWYGGPTTAPTVSDTVGGSATGNTYTPLCSVITSSVDSQYRSMWWLCTNGVGGANHVVTVNFGTAADLAIFLVEVTGGVTSSIVDQNPTPAWDTSSPYTLTTGATAQNNELVLAFAATYTTVAPATDTLDWTANGYTALDSQSNSLYVTGGMAYKVVTATGAQTPSVTSTGATTTGVGMHVITLKDAVSGGGGGGGGGGTDPALFFAEAA